MNRIVRATVRRGQEIRFTADSVELGSLIIYANYSDGDGKNCGRMQITEGDGVYVHTELVTGVGVTKQETWPIEESGHVEFAFTPPENAAKFLLAFSANRGASGSSNIYLDVRIVP